MSNQQNLFRKLIIIIFICVWLSKKAQSIYRNSLPHSTRSHITLEIGIHVNLIKFF